MMSKNDVAIEVKNVSKYFLLPHQKASSVKSFIVNPFARYDNEKQHALEDVSFEIKKGEFFGIVGRNGSGKSTLLKCMAGVYTPDKGHIKVNGTLVPFIELGVGFNPELSGRDNVYLNGALLGFSRTEVDAMYDEIVEFAELKEFMDQKLKNYSSGMQVRLAFSIAIRADGDILLLDEVLAVGDAAFQQKCEDYFIKLKKEKKTIVLVSHNMQAVEKFCDRALLLEGGRIVQTDQSQKIAAAYDKVFFREEAARLSGNHTPVDTEEPKEVVRYSEVQLVQKGKVREEIEAGLQFTVRLRLESNIDLQDINVGMNIKNHDKNILITADTKTKDMELRLIKMQPLVLEFQIENILTRGVYSINLGVSRYVDDSPTVIWREEQAHSFIVNGPKTRSLTAADYKVVRSDK